MKVDLGKAASAEYNGTRFYFCSQGCAAKFQTEPVKYVHAKQDIPLVQVLKKDEQKADYTCPMHPEVHQAGSGNCPKCGMALEAATVTTPASRTEYTCPMHPEIVRDQPGHCP